MSEIKALYNLHKLASDFRSDVHKRDEADYLLEIADNIQAEVDARFMALPLDADGVPIRVGETVYGKYLEGNPEFTVRGFSFDLEHVQWNVQVGDAAWTSANLLSHVKPRTLEDVLNDRINDVLRVMTSGIPLSLETALNDSFGEECADEIRELMKEGGDEARQTT